MKFPFYKKLLTSSILLLSTALSAEETPIVIRVDQIVDRIFSFSPELKINEAKVQDSEGTYTQASVYPNPVAFYSVEDVLGNNSWRGWRSAESRYEIAQLIELGSKRYHRQELSQYQIYAALAEFEASKLSLLNKIMKEITQVAASQENYLSALEQEKAASEMLQAITAKVESGKLSPIQQKKAEINHLHAELNLENAQLALETSKGNLSTLWGVCEPDFDWIDFDFYTIDCPPPLSTYLAELQDNPKLRQSQLDLISAHQNLKLEKANAIPDLILTVGYKTERDKHHQGMTFGAEVPLPIFNQNQGNIQKAQAAIEKTKQESIQLQLYLRNYMTIAHQELAKAYQEADQLQQKILKAAQETFNCANEGYAEGKFEYIDVLEAREMLFEIKEKLIDALLKYHQKRADIEYINTNR